MISPITINLISTLRKDANYRWSFFCFQCHLQSATCLLHIMFLHHLFEWCMFVCVIRFYLQVILSKFGWIGNWSLCRSSLPFIMEYMRLSLCFHLHICDELFVIVLSFLSEDILILVYICLNINILQTSHKRL